VDARAAQTMRGRRVRSSRVVLSPRRWGQVSRDDRRATVARKPETPGRSRSSRSTIAQGMPDRRRTCYDLCAVFLLFAHEAFGCSLRPAFPAPSSFRKARLNAKSGRDRAAVMRAHVSFLVIARSRSDEAIHVSACGPMDCFASLAMTIALFDIGNRKDPDFASLIRATV
jgi:hypothetical protein